MFLSTPFSFDPGQSKRVLTENVKLFTLYFPLQGETIPPENIALVETLIEPWFIFALVWSVGGTCDGDGRKKFSEFLRKKMDEEKVIFKERC